MLPENQIAPRAKKSDTKLITLSYVSKKGAYQNVQY